LVKSSLVICQTGNGSPFSSTTLDELFWRIERSFVSLTLAEDGIGSSPVVVKPILEFQYIPAEVVLLRLLLKLLFCVTKFFCQGNFLSNLLTATD
jgi:hypothetical protein